jgi:hypothetical protein
MTQHTLDDRVVHLVHRHSKIHCTSDVTVMEHGGLHGVIRTTETYQLRGGPPIKTLANTVSFVVSVWQWSQDRWENKIHNMPTHADLFWTNVAWHEHCMDLAWRQLGNSRCFGSQHAAESALLDLLEFPVMTQLRFG